MVYVDGNLTDFEEHGNRIDVILAVEIHFGYVCLLCEFRELFRSLVELIEQRGFVVRCDRLYDERF